MGSPANSGRSADEASEFLEARYGAELVSAHPLGAGRHSAALAFSLRDGARLVLRTSGTRRGFDKDRVAAERYSCARFPIPEIIEIGTLGRGYYAISERAEGAPLAQVPAAELSAWVPLLIDLALDVAETPPAAPAKFGFWDARGGARFARWSDFLLSVLDERRMEWQRWIAAGILDASLVADLSNEVALLAPRCADHRHLVHGDLNGENVLGDAGRITALLDWGQGLYGDFAYDVAQLALLLPAHGILQAAEARARERRLDVADIASRTRCARACIALFGLRFFAASGDAAEARRFGDWVRSGGAR